MNDLRKAAEMALDILDMCFYDEEDEVYWHREKLMDVRKALRQALDKPEIDAKVLVDMAVLAEREACAKVCDELAAKDKLSNYYAVAARAIRERNY